MVTPWPIRAGRASRATALALVGVALVLSGCGRGKDWRQVAAPAPAAEADSASGYDRPPQILGAQRGGDGLVTLSGRAEPNSRVRLLAPDGSAFGGTVSAGGDWVMTAPAGLGIYGLSEDLGGRIVQSEGYIVVLPSPGRAAALLRGGGGALVLDGRSTALRIAAADFDTSGATVISGFAPAGAALRLMVDGAAAAGEAKADAQGRFSMASPSALKPGNHAIRVRSGAVTATADIAVRPPGAISGPPIRAARQGGGWTVDWMTPAGGLQTSVILDP